MSTEARDRLERSVKNSGGKTGTYVMLDDLAALITERDILAAEAQRIRALSKWLRIQGWKDVYETAEEIADVIDETLAGTTQALTDGGE